MSEKRDVYDMVAELTAALERAAVKLDALDTLKKEQSSAELAAREDATIAMQNVTTVAKTITEDLRKERQ